MGANAKNIMNRTKLLVGVVATFAGMISLSQAQITPVASPSPLPTTDTIDWGQLGPNNTKVTSPANVTSGLGLNAVVSDGNDFFADVAGQAWSGPDIFPNGDKLLYNNDSGDVSISFATPISGAGAYLQTNAEDPFTAEISAYDSSDTLLGSESFVSVGINNDGPPVFAGLDSASNNISEVVFSITAGGTVSDRSIDDFALDTLDLNVPKTSSVPDAGSTSMLLGVASLGLGFIRRKVSKS
jgi:VPDSG-CTERM motif